jgi:hypothetical protein
MRDVESLVALQTNEVGVECGRSGRRKRRLAHARFSFEKQRLAEPKRQKQRDRQPTIGDVVLGCKPLLEL